MVSWAAVGPRTCASRAHRELASGLSTPVGFHRGAARDATVAVDAVRASGSPHAFLSVSKQGVAGIVETTGNCDCHAVVQARPGKLTSGGVEVSHLGVALTEECAALTKLGLPGRVMCDCGGNGEDRAQADVLRAAGEVAALVAGGDERVLGVRLPSFLLTGRQQIRNGKAATYGMSVTESCIDWGSTAETLQSLAAAVRTRRAAGHAAKKPRAQ